MRLPSGKNLATPAGARPEVRRFTSSHSEAHIVVGRGTSEAFSRCCMCSPDGPRADTLGKDLRTDWSQIEWNNVVSCCHKAGRTGVRT